MEKHIFNRKVFFSPTTLRNILAIQAGLLVAIIFLIAIIPDKHHSIISWVSRIDVLLIFLLALYFVIHYLTDPTVKKKKKIQSKLRKEKRDIEKSQRQIKRSKNLRIQIPKDTAKETANRQAKHATEMQALKQRRDRIPLDEKNELEERLRQEKNRHFKLGMAQTLIKDSKIKGIGRISTTYLTLYGVKAADDVVASRIINIPGFGEKTTERLVIWRKSVEADLRRTEPTTLPNDISSLIREKYQEKGREIDQEEGSVKEDLKSDLLAIKKRATIRHKKNDALEEKASIELKESEGKKNILDQRIKPYSNIHLKSYLLNVLGINLEKSPKRELLAYVSILVLVASSCFGQLSFAAFAAESAFVANIPTATDTATLTPIFTPSITWTPSSTYTASNTFTPSATFTASNTPTDTHTPTASFTPTRTFTPTQTFTPTPTLASGLASCIPTNTLREVGYVTNVIDGDTITVRINWVNYNVRYIGMDSPEGGAYYAWNATNRNRQLVQGQNVTLVTDVSNTDRYDRLLRYVIVGNTFVNHALVYEGFATALRYPPDIACASYFQTAENSANSSNRGMWAPTPTPLPPTTVPSTGGGGTGGTGGEGGDCHPSYPTVCIPYPPPDLNCGDISYRNFTVIGTDPHRFDGDNDGVGCET